MEEMRRSDVLLFFLIFLAGFIDSIAGGGGLISLSAYYAYGLPPLEALSNNKFSSTSGTVFSVLNYARNRSIIFKTAGAGAVAAIIGSFIGSYLALLFSDYYFRIFLLVMIPFVTLLTLKKRKEGRERRFSHTSEMVLTFSFSLVIGMYDGFFGPGTGMFLTLAFSFIGFSMLESAANSKLINLSSNVVALTVFLLNGSVDISLGIPCAVFSIIGNLLGSSIAIRFNSRIIRPMLIVVLVLLYLEVLNVF